MPTLEHSYFPGWRLGYRCNPFRALTQEEWQELALLPEELSCLLDEIPPLSQIVGDKGRGKTSALLALKRELSARGKQICYEYIPAGTNRFMQDAAMANFYLLDEAQRLSPRWFNKLLRLLGPAEEAGLALILSTHKDLSRQALSRRAAMTTIELERSSRQFIERMIMKRLRYFERPGHEGVPPTPQALDHLIVYCATDLRLLEKLLYEAFQTWDSGEPIDEKHVLGILKDAG